MSVTFLTNKDRIELEQQNARFFKIAENLYKRMPYGSEEFGIHLTADMNVSILDMVINLPECGFYTCFVQKGCPDNPVGAKNSSFRGFAHLTNHIPERPGRSAYGYIVLFDHTGTMFVQYIRDGVGQGWKNPDIDVDKELNINSENPVQNRVITAKISELEDNISRGADDNQDQNQHAHFFEIGHDGTVRLKPEYRGATEHPNDREDSISDASYWTGEYDSNNKKIWHIEAGTKNSELPAHLYIPTEVDGIVVTAVAFGIFDGNSAFQYLYLSPYITTLPNQFCYKAANLLGIHNTNGIIHIGNGAFSYTPLESVEFPSLFTIGIGVFRNCAYMYQCDLGGRITEIPANTFLHCARLRTLLGVQNVRKVGDFAFAYTRNLRKLEFLRDDVPLRSIGRQAFFSCSVDFDWWGIPENTTNVENDTSTIMGEFSTAKAFNPKVNGVGWWEECTTTKCANPTPTSLSQTYVKDRDVGKSGFKYANGCCLFTLIHAYSGITGRIFNDIVEVETLLRSIIDTEYDNGTGNLLDNFGKPTTNQWMVRAAKALGLFIDTNTDDEKDGVGEDDTGKITRVNVQKAYDALADGKYVMLAMVNSRTAMGGHVSLAYGINDNGELLILDSATENLNDIKPVNKAERYTSKIEYICDEDPYSGNANALPDIVIIWGHKNAITYDEGVGYKKECVLCGEESVLNQIHSASRLDGDFLEIMEAEGIGLEHVHSFSCGSIRRYDKMNIVEDPASIYGYALTYHANDNDNDYTLHKGVSTLTILGGDRTGTLIGEIDVNNNRSNGYQIYKTAENVVLFDDAGSGFVCIWTQPSWIPQFTIDEERKKELAGKTLDMYVALRVDGITPRDDMEASDDLTYYFGNVMYVTKHTRGDGCTVYHPTKYVVSFDSNGGSGTMKPSVVIENGQYKLPVCGFTAPEGKRFAGWKFGDFTVPAGNYIAVKNDTTLKPVWKN